MRNPRQKGCNTKFLGGAKRGQILVLSALSMVVLMGFAAVAIDIGSLWNTKRRMQTAADAAAVAGARELKNGNDPVAAARLDASQNGFTHSSNGIVVTVNHPPKIGGYSADNTAVETVISQARPTFFMRVLKINSVAVSARAVARAGKSNGCIWIMDPSANNALVVSGSGSITSSCSIQVNSSSSDAMNLSGGACITGPTVNIVGNYRNSSSCILNPKPNTGVALVADPFASVPAPITTGGCDHNKFSVTGTMTLSPGKYCGGITISGGATGNLNPGMYILAGGGLTVSGGSRINGTGVTFYNTNGQGVGGSSYSPIVISGTSGSVLSAPTSGTYSGMLFFEDRSINSSAQNTVSGGSNSQINGAMYFLNSPLVYSGGSNNTPSNTQIVADTLTVSGPSYLGGSASGPFVADSVVLGE